jgi:hypothetical protein
VQAIKRWRPYLLDAEFMVETDHAALLALRHKEQPTPRLVRWALELQAYHFALKHVKGAKHLVPDALSRLEFDDSVNPAGPDSDVTCRPGRNPSRTDHDEEHDGRGHIANSTIDDRLAHCLLATDKHADTPRCRACPSGLSAPEICAMLNCKDMPAKADAKCFRSPLTRDEAALHVRRQHAHAYKTATLPTLVSGVSGKPHSSSLSAGQNVRDQWQVDGIHALRAARNVLTSAGSAVCKAARRILAGTAIPHDDQNWQVTEALHTARRNRPSDRPRSSTHRR